MSETSPGSSGHGAAFVDGAEEARRARAARRLGRDVGAGESLDRLAELAARLLGTDFAQVSLMTDVQTIVGGAGLPPGMERREEALPDSFCTITARGVRPFVVEDARADHRVSALPSVAAGLAGSYLGVPLRSDGGQAVGSLCVIDRRPRTWTGADVRILEQLALSVVAELELTAITAEYESSRLRWALAVDAAGIGTYDLDVRTGRLVWDERLLELFGLPEDSFGGTIEAFNERLHPEDLPGVSAAIEAALGACGELDVEYRIVLPDGGTRWVQARGRALCDEGGEAVRLVGAAYDTTARREDDARVSRVLETMSAAFYSLDRDWRFSYVNVEAERLLGRTREELIGASLWQEFPASVGSEFERTYRGAVEDGQPAAFEAYYPAPLDGWYEVRVWPSPDGLAVYFVDITARRRLEADARRSAAHLALVAEVAAQLTGTLDAAAAVAHLARLVVPGLADWSTVTLFGEDGRAHDVGSWHVDPRLRPVVQRYAELHHEALAAVSPISGTLASERATLITEDAAARLGAVLEEGEARELLGLLAPQTALIVPLPGRARTLGLIALYSSQGSSHVEEGSFAAAEDVAARAGLALDNTRLYDQQRRLAEGLQRALLTEPPEPDNAQIVVRYRPAAEAARVGGDWYDAFMQADGATVLVIGDVVGHDTAAAAAMGQLRGLLRGIAYHTGSGPADVLSGLDAAMAGLAVDTTATAVVARIEQSPEQRSSGLTAVRWSNAGHPPPMVMTEDGEVTPLLAADADLLLGVDPETARMESVVELRRGATLLLYTDGLVERRNQGLDVGMELLASTLSDLSGRPLDAICDEVLARLVPSTAEDDVALVAVRLHRQDRPRPLEAGPERLPRAISRRAPGAGT